jgi:hypothetical protein
LNEPLPQSLFQGFQHGSKIIFNSDPKLTRSSPGHPRSQSMHYSALRSQDIRKIELARRLGCSPSQVDRLLDIQHRSKLDQLEAAFAAIGKRLLIRVRDLAA